MPHRLGGGIAVAEREVSDRPGQRLTVAFQIENPGARPARSFETEDFIVADRAEAPNPGAGRRPGGP